MKNFIIVFVVLFCVLASEAKDGFKIIDIEKGSIYQKVGLKKGDVITQINGVKLKSIEEFTAIWSEFKNGQKAELSIERNGKAKTLIYTIN